jgi:hypothetical protein
MIDKSVEKLDDRASPAHWTASPEMSNQPIAEARPSNLTDAAAYESAVEEFRELLLGTWLGVALIAEELVQADAVRRGDLLVRLGEGLAVARGRRRTSLAAMHKFISEGFGPVQARPTPCCRRRGPLSR